MISIASTTTGIELYTTKDECHVELCASRTEKEKMPLCSLQFSTCQQNNDLKAKQLT